MSQLPFSCRMVKDAAAADVEIVKPAAPKDGKYEVLFPVGMPDEGVFEWADQFIEKNPTYTEISDRKIIEWASKSNIERTQQAKGSSRDMPEMQFGIPLLDDLSVRKLLNVIAPTLNRNFLVMELKSNLISEERKAAIARFGDFKKVGVVAMGEPSADYTAKVHADMLAEKKKKAEAEQKKKEKEEERKRLFQEKKRKAEEARKAKLAAQKAKEGKEGEAEEEAKAEEEAPAEPAAEEKKEEPAAPEVVELTEDEKKLKHKKQTVPDLSQATLGKFYAKFALPDAAEGFDEVRYVWDKQAKCAELLGSWVHERKMTQRVEDLTPGEWFKELWGKWIKTLQDWKKKQNEWKDPAKRKAMLAKKKEEAKKAKAAAKAEAGEEKAEGEEAAAAEEEEEKPMEIE